VREEFILSTSSPLVHALAAVAIALAFSSRAYAQDDDLVVPSQQPATASPPVATAPAAASASMPAASPPPALVPAPVPAPPADDLRAEVRALQDEVRELRARQDAPHSLIEIWDNTKSSTSPWDIPGRDGIWLTGYLQSQYETHQDSQDQLSPSGAPLNKDRFLIRRTRLKLIAEWKFVETQIELNADTTNGPNINLHHAEASLHYRLDPTKVPLVQATLGLFDTPFGYEVPESPRSRPFMERTTASRAFWAGEPDLGLRMSGGIAFFRWTIAAVNGFPLDSPTYALQDPTGAKDLIVRLGVDTAPRAGVKIAGEVSLLQGSGFHAGTAATKSTIQWTDVNQDGIVQPSEINGIGAQAATPSQIFPHWAVGADLQLSTDTPIGTLKVYGEIELAQNLDRALFIADPIESGTNLRELGWYVAGTQEITRYGLIGFRYDYYDPNADFFDHRSGLLIPSSEVIETYSPLVGLVLPNRARALVQYDIIRNHYGRNAEGEPTNLKMNTLTLRLQVEL
jgi:hypothetical protein